MESPDTTSKVSSPDHAPDRSLTPKSPMLDDMEKTTYIRFLVSHAEAGCVIGKGGATITDFQLQSGARIQISRNLEFFPGTSDRIIMVSGRENEVIKAMDLVLSKLLSEIPIDDEDSVDARSRVRLVVPNSSCGGIIGKGGSNIRSFIEESQAGIKISPQDNTFYGVNDRLVTLTGSLEEVMRAIDLILSKLMEDSHYSQSTSVPFPYTVSYNRTNYGSNGAGGKFQNGKADRGETVTIGIADDHIGLVVGRAGRVITEISQISGTRIKISDRGDFIPGTNERKVMITGSPRSISTAQSLIMEKVAAATER